MDEPTREGVAAALERVLHEVESGATWENDTLPRYLEALAAWLRACPGYYKNQGRGLPENPWEVILDAIEAAKIYE